MNARRRNRTMAIDPLESLDQRVVPSNITLSPIAVQQALILAEAGNHNPVAISTLSASSTNIHVLPGHPGSFMFLKK